MEDCGILLARWRLKNPRGRKLRRLGGVLFLNERKALVAAEWEGVVWGAYPWLLSPFDLETGTLGEELPDVPGHPIYTMHHLDDGRILALAACDSLLLEPGGLVTATPAPQAWPAVQALAVQGLGRLEEWHILRDRGEHGEVRCGAIRDEVYALGDGRGGWQTFRRPSGQLLAQGQALLTKSRWASALMGFCGEDLLTVHGRVVQLWNPQGQCLQRVELAQSARSLAIAPAGSSALIGGENAVFHWTRQGVVAVGRHETHRVRIWPLDSSSSSERSLEGKPGQTLERHFIWLTICTKAKPSKGHTVWHSLKIRLARFYLPKSFRKRWKRVLFLRVQRVKNQGNLRL